MNFEQLYKFIIKYKTSFSRNRWKLIKNLIKHHYSVVKLNRQKLKLGKVIFVINTFDLNKPFQEPTTLKFINQDLSESLEEKLKSFDEDLRWKWTKTHVGSLVLVLGIAMYYLWKFIKIWCQTNLPFLYFHSITFENLLHYMLDRLLSSPLKEVSSQRNLDAFIIDLIFQFCLYFNIII